MAETREHASQLESSAGTRSLRTKQLGADRSQELHEETKAEWQHQIQREVKAAGGQPYVRTEAVHFDLVGGRLALRGPSERLGDHRRSAALRSRRIAELLVPSRCSQSCPSAEPFRVERDREKALSD